MVKAVAAHVGIERAVKAAPELMVALGLSLPERAELADARYNHSPPPVAAPPGNSTRIAGRIPLTAGRPARRGLTAMPGALHAPARSPRPGLIGQFRARADSAPACVRRLREEHQRRLDPLADVIGAAESKLRKDRVDVLFDGVSGQEERLCNRRVALAPSNLGQHLALA